MKHTYLTFIALGLAGWLVLSANTAVFADSTLTVYPNEVAIANNGRCSLREAIINANNNAATHPDCPAGTGDDTIIIPAGTYTLNDATTPDEDFSATGDLDLSSNITLQGAGTNTTILDGNHTDRVLHILTGVVVINDVTIRHGRTPDGADNLVGCTSGFCSATGEHASPGGGILTEGTLTLNRVLVTDNQTGAGGAGGDLTCSLPENTCTTRGGYGGDGAGIYSNGPSLTIHNSIIQHNHTGVGGAPGNVNCSGGATCYADPSYHGDGGGLKVNTGNTLTVTLSRIANNSGRFGGGIDCAGACAITHSVIQDNSATSTGGGVLFNHNSAKTMSHTIVANNAADGSGGGIYANLGTLTITNVTISGNSSGLSGGGFYSQTPTTLNHVTVANNTADADSNGSGDGGGIFKFGTLNLKNSVVADNIDTGGQAPDCWGTITSQFYNHIENITGCTFTPGTGDVTGSDPSLGLLADNGGVGQTHRPNAGSPLLDSIPFNTNDCGDVVTTDQRGAVRSYPANGACDKGAVEVRAVVQNCSLSTGVDIPINGITLNFASLGSLSCVSVEEMGNNHPAATGVMGDSGMFTGNWWHISGNVDNGFDVTVTLPHSGLADPQVCKYPGTQGGYGWDCARTGADGSTVSLNGVDSFSDWTVGDAVGPTAVTNLQADTTPAAGQGWLVGLLVGLLGAATAVFLRRAR